MSFCNRFRYSNVSTIVDDDDDDGTVFTENTKGERRHYSPGQLVRPLSSVELLYAIGSIFNTLHTVQAIWLDSKLPFSQSNVLNALRILSRQIPHFQLCLSRKGIRLWFKRIENFAIDFETTNDEVMDVYQQLLETSFEIFSSPLWKVRLVVLKQKENMIQSAVIIFCVSHIITDVSSNMRISREFTSLLNGILEGKSIEPCPIPVTPRIEKEIKIRRPSQYLIRYICKGIYQCFFKNSSFHGSFNILLLPILKPKEPQMQVLFDDFTQDETKILIQMCKAAKVTVHSFITTVMNFALLSVAQTFDDFPIGYKRIRVCHSVNLRKYFVNPKYKDGTGCHVSLVDHETNMSLADAKNIMEIAKQLHDDLKEMIEDKDIPINIYPFLPCAIIMFPINSFLKRIGRNSKNNCHYTTTNMGDLKDLLPEPKEGDNVEISYILRSATGESGGTPFILTFHTFRKRLMISMDSFSNKINPAVAAHIFEVFSQYIRNMVHLNHLQQKYKSN